MSADRILLASLLFFGKSAGLKACSTKLCVINNTEQTMFDLKFFFFHKIMILR